MNEFITLSRGCIPSKVDLRDYKIKACVSAFPDEFEIPMTHKIKNQGYVGSCVAHSTSEILEEYARRDLGNDVTLSTNFIYGTQKKLYNQTASGMYPKDALKTVKKYGDPTAAMAPGNVEVPKCYASAEALLQDDEVLDNAYTYHIDSYFSCPNSNDLKYALMNYGPCLFTVKWYNKYTIDTKNCVRFDLNTDFGYHALVCYGWNKDGWLFQNSWGEAFGRNGCAVMPFLYGYGEAWALIDWENPKPTPADDNIIVDPKQDENLVRPDYGTLFSTILKFVSVIINLFKK